MLGLVQQIGSSNPPAMIAAPLPVVQVPQAASVAIDLGVGRIVTLVLTTNAAFVIATPTGFGEGGFQWWLNIRNASGGAHGAGTFSADFRVPGNVPAIATGSNRWFLYNCTQGLSGVQREMFRGAADVPT